ncbi:MAG: 30S ribosomal protein S6 [Bacteroidetes bacterium]|nr:30S ribosomal protein S6 [Bacteroidota bacterium]
MFMKNYETVFILNPVLSEDQAKDTVEKFVKVLTKAQAEIVNKEFWGLKKMAYEIQNKSTGFYNLIEFTTENTDIINTLETEFRRDESVMRFLTLALDKHAVAYNARRKKGEFNRTKKVVSKKREEAAA